MLLRKGATFEFGEEQIYAFERLKKKLIEASILSIYNPDPTELHSNARLRAVLIQQKNG